MQKALEALKKLQSSMNTLYPNYQSSTNDIYDIISEMLSVDYLSLSSDKKKLRIVKDYLRNIFEAAFSANGHKGYMREILNVFLNSDISAYIVGLLKTEGQNFVKITECLKYELIYWQGCEGCMDRKLEKILACI